MADNYETNPGSGGKTFASDEDGGAVNWPYTKVVYGADGTQTLVSTANPMPVDIRTENLAGALTVDGTVIVQDGGGALTVDGIVTVQDGGSSLTVDGTVTANAGTGTFAVSGTVTANAGTGTFAVSGGVAAAGDVAHDAADSGNPVKVGLVGRTAHPTAVADGDRVNGYGDDLGRLVTYPFAPRDLITHNRIVLTSTTETTLIAAGGAGVFRDIVWLGLSNESATKVRVDIRDATAGTVRFSLTLAADGGGGIIALPVPLTQATAANNWTAQLSAAVTSVYVQAIAVSNN